MSSFQLQNAEVLARLKPFGILFEKSLSDLIKGIRSYSKESAESLLAFLDSAIMECKNELSTTDLETKAMAILKLTYLEMYGFEMSWCNFQILEVMSSSKFQQKRIGYLAAIQSFKNEQDLLILATNQFKKDLNSHNHIEIGLALSGIATIVTPNLSKDINDDVLIKLNHSKPYIRKKAVLAMYKIFLQYPDSLRMNFNRIIDKLDDSDISVVSATINVICEISKKNPNVFVTYLPKFFTILEGTKNNWLIIRILKLFQSLSKVEPRMKKKILPTIMELMLKTQASSLIYECINCIVNGSMLYPDSSKDRETAKTCIEQIMNFFETRDSNLKFVGLLALINILQIFPDLMHKVKGVSQVIMDCLTDNDLIIKRKALEVSSSLVTEDNITELVKVLLVQLIPSETTAIPETLKLEITMKILSISSKDNYSNIPNFKWYIAVLKDMINLTLLPLSSINNATISQSISNSIASAIGKEFKILATRVPSIRSAILNKVISDAVQDVRILENCPLLLRDFYWIMGEYIDEFRITSDESDEDEDISNVTSEVDIGKLIQIFNTLVNNKIDCKLNLVTSLNFPISAKLLKLQQSEVLVVLIQALIKLYNGIVTGYNSVNGSITQENYKQLSYFLFKLINFLENWEYHSNYEVQERALSWLEFLKLCLEAMVKNNYAAIEKLESEEVEYYKQLALAEKKKDGENESLSDSDDDDDDEEIDDQEDSDETSDEDASDEEASDEESSDEEDNEENSLKTDTKIHLSKNYENLLSLDEEKEDANAIDLNGAAFNSSSIENALQLTEDYSSHSPESFNEQLPMLLTHVLPSFFKSYPLNPISWNSQRKIQIPQSLNLDNQINVPPIEKLSEDEDNDEDSYSMFLSDDSSIHESDYPLINLSNEGSQEDLRKKQERIERLKDDPYYITSTNNKKSKSKSKSNKLLVADDEKQSSPDFNEISSIHSGQQLKSKKPKSKKVKKERVVILSEETIEGSNNEPEPEVVQPSKPRKKNVLNIDSSNLNNFDLNSSSISDTASTIEPKNKPYEYDIDLDDLRTKLAESSIGKKPKKSKKSKSKKKEKDGGDKKITNEDASNAGNSTAAQEHPSTTEDNIISVKRPKKTKKKNKAIILEQ
ncbi:uncharacterized protein AC631_03972 [Debaryomyces fabryi]|uniref:AP-3 complex subunit delta n=1 Tax=Debaryomyces fabryi TaxID=58627 RepID=A0A0V1PVZ4_9ASCO|nr:uncharacterized protein AC631_03972 [Debaryomyces fabryi]KSA00266.1 hypothetical protein AC631_03972 [Debaryomyces fabryi]CUM50586.1 unnamed protein product [Debaryomyces fabryi]